MGSGTGSGQCRTTLHVRPSRGPSRISLTGSHVSSPRSYTVSMNDAGSSYACSSAGAFRRSIWSSARRVTAGRLILGITRRCVPPFSSAPSTTPLPCHPSTAKVVYAEPSRELSHTRTVASAGASGASADVGAGRIHGRTSVRCFSVPLFLASRAPELGGSKPG